MTVDILVALVARRVNAGVQTESFEWHCPSICNVGIDIKTVPETPAHQSTFWLCKGFKGAYDGQGQLSASDVMGDIEPGAWSEVHQSAFIFNNMCMLKEPLVT